MRWLGKGFNPDFVIRFFDSLPAGEIWRAFQNYDEVENAAGDSPWETGGCFFSQVAQDIIKRSSSWASISSATESRQALAWRWVSKEVA